MQQIELGKTVPDFELASTGDATFQLSKHLGKNILIYFYPKDNTPGCTLEGQNFRDHIAEFSAHDTLIFGISRDSARTHENFKAKHEFPFELLSDPEETACTLFNVLHLKKNYGREYMGIVRSSFLIDKQGVLRHEWRNIKVKEHITEVLAAITTL